MNSKLKWEDVVEPAADGYRGDLSCLRVKPPYKEGRKVAPPSDGHVAWEVVDAQGRVGILEWWYGNGGQGSDAAARFYLD